MGQKWKVGHRLNCFSVLSVGQKRDNLGRGRVVEVSP